MALGTFSKLAVVGALCALAACSQTVTKADGSKVESSTPTWVANYDRIAETFKDQKLALTQVKAGSRFYRSARLGTVTGFDRPTMFSLAGAPISDSDAAKIVAEQLGKANLLNGSGKNVLDVTLKKYSWSNKTTTVLEYVLKDPAGAVILTEQQTADFTVPFKAAPMGGASRTAGSGRQPGEQPCDVR